MTTEAAQIQEQEEAQLPFKKPIEKKSPSLVLLFDILTAVGAGIVVGFAYHIFQNSNGFAPGGVGGLATIAYHFLNGADYWWTIFMVAFNIPIFSLVSLKVNRKLGLLLSIYLLVQSFMPQLFNLMGIMPYSLANSGEDFNILFAAVATGVISGFGFSIMLRRFGASGGTYAISALIKLKKPDLNLAVVAFIMDACVVGIAFFVYGMRITPVMCTLINLFIASVVVDHGLNGLKNGYKFELVTAHPEELAAELMQKLHHGVTRIEAHGMYSGKDKTLLICIINKRQIGIMMKILKSHPDVFASFEKVNEVFGNFKRKV